MDSVKGFSEIRESIVFCEEVQQDDIKYTVHSWRMVMDTRVITKCHLKMFHVPIPTQYLLPHTEEYKPFFCLVKRYLIGFHFKMMNYDLNQQMSKNTNLTRYLMQAWSTWVYKRTLFSQASKRSFDSKPSLRSPTMGF